MQDDVRGYKPWQHNINVQAVCYLYWAKGKVIKIH